MGLENTKPAREATLTAREIDREARRILRCLAEREAHLAPVNGAVYALHHGARMERRVQTVPAAIVEHFLRNGWLAQGESRGSYVLGEAGRGWLARADCSDGDPFQAQHQLRTVRVVEDAAGIARQVTVNQGEDPLGWLLRRRVIDRIQYNAGERLRRDFTFAQMAPRLCVDLETPVVLKSRTPDAIHDKALAAGERFRAALKSVGPGLSDLLFDICCDLKGLEDAEAARGWPRRSAKVVLQLALDRLAAHYGIATTAPAQGKIRSWMGDSA